MFHTLDHIMNPKNSHNFNSNQEEDTFRSLLNYLTVDIKHHTHNFPQIFFFCSFPISKRIT